MVNVPLGRRAELETGQNEPEIAQQACRWDARIVRTGTSWGQGPVPIYQVARGTDGAAVAEYQSSNILLAICQIIQHVGKLYI